jgi:hypothetical protein
LRLIATQILAENRNVNGVASSPEVFMKTRAAKFMAALIASILSSASLSAAPDDAAQQPDSNAEQPAETCLTTPRDYAPPGTRWRYRVERSSGRHCWFLKDDAEKAAGKTAAQSTAATEEPAAAAPRRKSATSRSVSDARAEFSQLPVEQDARPAPVQRAPAAGTAVAENNQPSAAKSANMLAPAPAARWPDPTSAVSPAANPPAPATAPADQSAEARPAPPAKPQVMPRAVPPMPASEKPMSLPMLITIIAGGLSVLAVLVSVLFAWLAARKAKLSPSAPMPPLELPDQPRRPGDLYRARKRMRSKFSKRRAA